MDELTYNPADLIHEYAFLFARREIFGFKTFIFPYIDFDVFVTRARCLIAETESTHLNDLFQIRALGDANAVAAGSSHQATLAAAWIAGIQKNRFFIPKIDELINEEKHIGYLSSARYAAVLLFDDPDLHYLFRRAFDSKEISVRTNDQGMSYSGRADTRALAIVCLELLDRRHGTKHSAAVPKDLNDRQRSWAENRMKKIMEASEILKAGMDGANPEDLKKKLKQFLSISTSFKHHFLGALRKPYLRHFVEDRDIKSNLDWIKRRDQFIAEHQIYRDLGLSIPHDRVKEFCEEWDRFSGCDRPKIKSDRLLQRYAGEYLKGDRKDPYWLRIAGRAANNSGDILSTLDMDINNEFPADFVDLLYERLGEMIAFDAEGYTQHANDLLMRTDGFDVKATNLLEKASTLRKEVVEHPNYLGVRMAATWKPLKDNSSLQVYSSH